MTTSHTLPATLDVDLPGLSAAAAPWVALMPVADQRIQSSPDSRALRFYQSTGLLDRPARYDGRTARYGRRHLLQILSVRALQSHGLSLAQIQTALQSATDEELEAIVNAVVRLRTTTHLGAKLPEPDPYAAPRSAPPALPLQAKVDGPALTAVELAPGIVVTIDSRLHPDPTRVIALLRRAIPGEQL